MIAMKEAMVTDRKALKVNSKSIKDLLKMPKLDTDLDDDVQSELQDFGDQLSYMQEMVEPSAGSPSLCTESTKRRKTEEDFFGSSGEITSQHYANTPPSVPLDLKLKELAYSHGAKVN